jgi:endonuclease/exonuclease/phosphatase family metal-dependent hydrolase
MMNLTSQRASADAVVGSRSRKTDCSIAAMMDISMIRLPELPRRGFVHNALWQKVAVLVSTALVVALMLCGLAWAVFVFQPFGDRHWSLVAVAATLAAVTVKFRRGRDQPTDQITSPERLFGRSLRLGRRVLASALACWLALIVWSAVSPGGAMPPAKSNPAAIRVLTWNILHGTDRGMPWMQFGWPTRKKAIATVLAGAKPEILCVQEALEEQGEFLAELLPSHRRVGVGRDDGRTAGEHCSILFDRSRFEELGGGTFWLEEPTDRPPAEFRLGPKRICTWARLRDRQTGRALRVYNTHQYLTEQARVRAVELMLSRIDAGDPSDAVFITGDFNAPPDTQDRRLLEAVGFVSSAQVSGVSASSSTYQFYGIRLRRLDDILVDRSWRVVNQFVIDAKPGNTFPSDHFGVMADLVMKE